MNLRHAFRELCIGISAAVMREELTQAMTAHLLRVVMMEMNLIAVDQGALDVVLGGFACGGPVRPKLRLVGDRGHELIVPKAAS